MSLAAISLAALFVIVFLSCITELNVGVLAIGTAWVIGIYLGGMPVNDVVAGFPSQLFLTLVGVTLLFSQAQTNGTLDKVAHKAVRVCRGNAGLIPVMFFLVAAALASIGPGNIASAALMAPVAMSVGAQAKVPPFLMAIMVGNGANAGSLSPFAPTGIIVNGLMSKIGMTGLHWQVYGTNLLAHAGVAFTAYLLFGGWRLFASEQRQVDIGADTSSLDRNNWLTIAVIVALLSGAIFFQIQVGLGAFLAAGVLGLLQAADHKDSVKRIPWNVILMVTGVTVLIAVLEKTQGLALFTELLARIATKESVTALVAFLTGLVSAYSSTSGVVLPAFLPTVPGLSQTLGADAVAIAFSMNVGSHLVDVSPLSTIGALCIAAAPAGVDVKKLFNALLAWGLSMTVVGAVVCWAFFRT
ncbi:MAG TPA: SLC13 family permease [Bryobacteraceae bacterium]|nr:SLC13 family permease [Bryobacteraceae bacterium]